MNSCEEVAARFCVDVLERPGLPAEVTRLVRRLRAVRQSGDVAFPLRNEFEELLDTAVDVGVARVLLGCVMASSDLSDEDADDLADELSAMLQPLETWNEWEVAAAAIPRIVTVPLELPTATVRVQFRFNDAFQWTGLVAGWRMSLVAQRGGAVRHVRHQIWESRHMPVPQRGIDEFFDYVAAERGWRL